MNVQIKQLPVKQQALRQTVRKCIVGHQSGSEKLAHETVTTMEDSLLARGWPQGDPLGTLAEMQKQFGLGRWACREAIAIMQMRGLIDIRRGPGGGLYVSQPSTNKMAKSLLLFLSLNRNNCSVLLDARLAVGAMVVTTLLRKGVKVDVAPTSPRAFRYALAEATGNQAILFLTDMLDEADDCLAASANAAPQDWSPQIIERHILLAAAINAGEDAVAQDMVRRCIRDTNRFKADQKIGLTGIVREVASLNRHKFSGSLAARIVDEILSYEGKSVLHLGSEWQIGDRFGYNGEIVRQAIRMLEDVGIVESQRGRRGGVVSVTPQNGPLIRQLTPCLFELRVTPAENFEAVNQLAVAVAELAAQKVRDGLVVPPADIPEHLFQESGANLNALTDDQLAAGISAVITLENYLLDLADNPILSVLIRGFALHFLFLSGPELKGSPELTAALQDCNRRVIKAILAGDVAEAVAATSLKEILMRPGQAATVADQPGPLSAD